MKCKFEEFLISYQPDLKRIVGKYLSKHLHIKVDDVVSVVNYQLIKTKQKFFDRFEYNFTKTDFSKWAYRYARNLTKWEALRYISKDEKLKDGCFYTESGEKSLFDIVIEEDQEFHSGAPWLDGFEVPGEFDSGAKIKVIEDIINKYSHILAPGEKRVFAGLLHGKTELELAEEADVTRQAINLIKIRVFDKIRAHYNSLSLNDVRAISTKEMDKSIDDVLEIFNHAEVRRLKYHSVSKNPNKNLYIYAND